MNRRTFLKQGSAGVAALGAGVWIARGQASPNGRLGIGMIGVGTRGSDHLNDILRLADKHNVHVAAICDVWAKNRQAAVATVQQRTNQEPKQFSRFADLLALREVDAVIIATPDFSHAPILLAALKANKDVYVEKPMTLDIQSANEALDLARARQRIVQAGTQHRSEAPYRGAAKLLATGVLGHISRVSVAMNFNEARWARDYSDCQAADVDWDAYLLGLPKRSFDAKLLRRWHFYQECTNGLAGLWMTHYADAICLLTGAKYPSSAVAHGGIYVWKDGREHTDTFHALLDYPEGFLFDWAMGLANSAGTHFTVHGTKGTADCDKWTISPAGGVNTTVQAGPIPPDPGPSHMDNWLTCLRTRQLPNADIQFGHQHVVATVMAAAALHTGQRQKFDPVKRIMFAG
jgi:predicted dehydrogenase